MSAFPPGWYQDPFGRADVRWWSGIEWTSHVARGGQPFDDAPVPSAAAGFDAVWVIDVATNTLSQPIDVGGWPRRIAGCAAET